MSSSTPGSYITEYQVLRDLCFVLLGVHKTGLFKYNSDTQVYEANQDLQLSHLTKVIY